MANLKDFYMMLMTYLIKYDPDGFKSKFPNEPNILKNNYDFIIVGGGSSGSVLANRLSERADWNILLVEAGGEENAYSRAPITYFSLMRSSMDFNYSTTNQSRTCLKNDGVCDYPLGKVLGGGSSINAMLYTMGYASDYDSWAAMGNSGWNFENIKKYFPDLPQRPKKPRPENRIGQMSVEYAKFRRSIAEDFMKVGLSLGFKMGDCHEVEKNCIEYPYATMLNGSRCSTARAFLEPLSRENLHILKYASVTKVLFESNSARGVEILYEGEKHQVYASKEIILSAGAVNSPKILMLSGIGPKEHLEKVGIPLKMDLPVGENLQDHNKVALFIEINTGDALSLRPLMNESVVEKYVEQTSGPITSTGIEALAFVNLDDYKPNVEYHITDFVGHPNKSIFAISTTVLRPKSRGTVRLGSENFECDPMIDPNYYSHRDDYDLTLSGLKYSLKMFKSKEFLKYRPKLFKERQPMCIKYNGRSFLDCIIKYYTVTNYHPVGTASMGEKGVVDSRLRVHGVSRLRVIDASIAPTILSANTNSMAMIIGEMGADLIKNQYP